MQKLKKKFLTILNKSDLVKVESVRPDPAEPVDGEEPEQAHQADDHNYLGVPGWVLGGVHVIVPLSCFRVEMPKSSVLIRFLYVINI